MSLPIFQTNAFIILLLNVYKPACGIYICVTSWQSSTIFYNKHWMNMYRNMADNENVFCLLSLKNFQNEEYPYVVFNGGYIDHSNPYIHSTTVLCDILSHTITSLRTHFISLPIFQTGTSIIPFLHDYMLIYGIQQHYPCKETISYIILYYFLYSSIPTQYQQWSVQYLYLPQPLGLQAVFPFSSSTQIHMSFCSMCTEFCTALSSVRKL